MARIPNDRPRPSISIHIDIAPWPTLKDGSVVARWRLYVTVTQNGKLYPNLTEFYTDDTPMATMLARASTHIRGLFENL
jgi:hypothetical protein